VAVAGAAYRLPNLAAAEIIVVFFLKVVVNAKGIFFVLARSEDSEFPP
jgi:hypothetical protein